MKKYKTIHLNLTSTMPKMDYLYSLVKRLSDFGANSLLIDEIVVSLSDGYKYSYS